MLFSSAGLSSPTIMGTYNPGSFLSANNPSANTASPSTDGTNSFLGQAIFNAGSGVSNAASNPMATTNPGGLLYTAGTTPLNANFANNANQITTGVAPQQLNANFANNANQINTNFANPNLLNQQVTDALYKQQTQYLDPQFQRSQAALENQLANQGLTRGSEAWQNSMDMANAQKQQAYESARNAAINAGVNAGSTLFQNQLAGQQAGNQALGQQFGQGLAAQQAGNAALQNQFGMGLQNAALQNAALGQQFNQGLQAQQAGNTAQNQIWAQNLANAQLGNKAYLDQAALDQAKQNVATMADAMKTQGLYGIGAGLLNSPNSAKNLSSLWDTASGAVKGLGGLFGGGAALPDWATGITDAETLNALGLGSGGLGGLFGVAAPWLGGAAALDKLTGGGVGKAASDLVSGAGDVLSDIGDWFG